MSRGDLQIQDLRVIKMLSTARSWVTTKQISDQLDLPQRTVQRILQAAEAAGFPMVRGDAAMGGGIKLVGDFSVSITLPSDLVEMAALLVGQQLVRQAAGDTVLGEAFEQLTHRLMQQMKSEQREICERFARMYQTKKTAAPANASPIATIVHRATNAAQVLVIEYRSPKDAKAKGREIEPLGIYATPERTYVVARDTGKAALRVFALERILSARETERTFTPDASFDVASFFAGSLGVYVAEPVDLEMRLSPEAFRRMGKKMPHASARVAKRPDGGATVRVSVPLSDELLAWMVSVGPGVSVIAPAAASTFAREGFARRAAEQPGTVPARAEPPNAPRAKRRTAKRS